MIGPRRTRCGARHTFFCAVRAGRAPSAAGAAALATAAALALAACLGAARFPPPLESGEADPESEREALELHERGLDAAAERRDDAAWAAFDSVVRLHPAARPSTASLRERGLAAYRLGRHAEAAADLREILARAPDYERVETAVVLASALQRGGHPADALRALARNLPAEGGIPEGARLVAGAAVRGLAEGEAPRLAAELPERPYLAPLLRRAAEELRATDPARAAELARAADRMDGGVEPPPAAAPPERAPSAGGVAAILPAAGALAGVARDIEDGVRLALAELASPGAQPALEVLPESGPQATSAALAALADRGVRVVIGPLESEDALVAARVALEKGVLLVTPTATDPALRRLGPGVVAPNATEGELGEAMGRYAGRELGLLRAAIIGADDEYGRAQAAGFRRAFAGEGGAVVLEQLFSRGATNFGAALRLARRNGAQALFLPTRSADQVLTVLSQTGYYAGGGFRMLGTEVWRDERFLRRAGSFAEGGLFADTFSPEATVSRWWEFRTRYFDRYGRSVPNLFPAWGYDAAVLALRHLLPGSAAAGADAAPGTPVPARTVVGAAATYRIEGGIVRKVPVVSQVRAGGVELRWVDPGA
jgi:branched-chain amino acid transport system substrate-binding protein